jgi:hypothetical protein
MCALLGLRTDLNTKITAGTGGSAYHLEGAASKPILRGWESWLGYGLAGGWAASVSGLTVYSAFFQGLSCFS